MRRTRKKLAWIALLLVLFIFSLMSWKPSGGTALTIGALSFESRLRKADCDFRMDFSPPPMMRFVSSSEKFAWPLIPIPKSDFVGRLGKHVSIGLWAWLDAYPVPGIEWCMISQGSYRERFKLSISASRTLVFTLKFLSGKVLDFIPDRVLELQTWYYVALTFDGERGRVAIYYDGVLSYVSGKDMARVLKQSLHPSTQPVTLGKCDPEDDAQRFKGQFGDPFIWDSTLSIGQVKLTYELRCFSGTTRSDNMILIHIQSQRLSWM